MPSLFSRLRPCPGRCPRCWCWRRPLRRLLPPPPPPEGLPGAAFIVLSNCYCWSGCCTEFRIPQVSRSDGRAKLRVGAHHHFCALAGYRWKRSRTNPTSERTALSNETLLSVSRFSVIGSVRRRLGTAGAKGLRGNEA